MADGGLSLPGLSFMGAGLLLAYSGLNDPVGGPVGALKDILQGRTPTSGDQKRISDAYRQAGATVGGALSDIAGGIASGAAAGGAAAGVAVSGGRAQIVAVAQTYLGTPYRLGSASRKGIDCSGLVLVAYRDAVGIKLPHKATLQMARGHRIDRAQILPGDLVGWGFPGNYPHIALAVDADTVIVAPTWGKKVQYQKLWQKKVPGFGYPDIVRILGD